MSYTTDTLSPAPDAVRTARTVLTLVAAIADDAPVNLIYSDEPGMTTIRKITPRSIKRCKNGQTIVRAFCHVRSEPRSFRMERILDAVNGPVVLV